MYFLTATGGYKERTTKAKRNSTRCSVFRGSSITRVLARVGARLSPRLGGGPRSRLPLLSLSRRSTSFSIIQPSDFVGAARSRRVPNVSTPARTRGVAGTLRRGRVKLPQRFPNPCEIGTYTGWSVFIGRFSAECQNKTFLYDDSLSEVHDRIYRNSKIIRVVPTHCPQVCFFVLALECTRTLFLAFVKYQIYTHFKFQNCILVQSDLLCGRVSFQW